AAKTYASVAVVLVTNGAGTQASTRGSGNANEAGITPTTAVGTPSKLIDRPTMCGSCPNRRIQKPWESTATGEAPCAVSASVNQRPCACATPSTDVSDDVVRETRTRSGAPCPVNVCSVAPI